MYVYKHLVTEISYKIFFNNELKVCRVDGSYQEEGTVKKGVIRVWQPGGGVTGESESN